MLLSRWARIVYIIAIVYWYRGLIKRFLAYRKAARTTNFLPLYIASSTTTIPREKRTNTRQPSSSKYIANLEKEATVKRATKKSNKRKAPDSNKDILRRESS